MNGAVPLGTQPTPPPAGDLSAIFGATGRSDNLRGRLAVRRPSTPDVAELEPPVTARHDEGQPAPGRQGSGTTRRRGRDQPAAAADVTRPVIAYVPASTRARLRAAARAGDGATYTDIVLDAVEHTHERLPALLAASAPQPRKSALFTRAPIAAAATGAEPNVQVHLRTTVGNLAVIDQLVTDCAGGDRSRLIATALDAYLPATPKDRQLAP